MTSLRHEVIDFGCVAIVFWFDCYDLMLDNFEF